MKKEYKQLVLIILSILIIILKDIVINKRESNYPLKVAYDVNIQNIIDDYNKFLSQYNLSNNMTFKCISRVKNRNISDFYDYITIYNNCNISKGNIITSSKGMIGVVDKVSKNDARVMLVTNSKSQLSVRIDSNFGTLKSKKERLYIDDLIDNKDELLNKDVVTSGLTSVMPNIKIGTISKITDDLVIVKPTADIKSIQYIAVLGE